MFREEAIWLGNALARHSTESLTPMVNLGSSTGQFRQSVQPFIHELVFRPLADRGVRVFHTDLKEGDGVDLVGDFRSSAHVERLSALHPKSVICTNIMEHVTDRSLFVENLEALVPPGGLAFVTVPRSFPYHPDPIDTMYRPQPSDVLRLFEGWELIDAAILTCSRVRQVRSRPGAVATRLLRTIAPFYRRTEWRGIAAGWLWVVRPYRQTCVVLRRLEEPTLPRSPERVA